MDNTSFSLSYLRLIGPIGFETPNIILELLAQCHGIKYTISFVVNVRQKRALIDMINHQRVNIIQRPYDRTDYTAISQFVNPSVVWTNDRLITALNSILLYFQNNGIYDIDKEFIVGLPTPDSPYLLHPNIIYAACCHYKLKLNVDTTLDIMQSILRQYLSNNKTYLISELTYYLRFHETNFKTHNIINALQDLGYYDNDTNTIVQADPLQGFNTESNDKSKVVYKSRSRERSPPQRSRTFVSRFSDVVTYDTLSKSIQELSPRLITSAMIDSYQPNNNNDIVAFFALSFNLDIFKAENPWKEFRVWQKDKLENYVPYDKVLKEKYHSPYSKDSLSLNNIFNAYLPKTCYNKTIMEKLALAEGYTKHYIETVNLYSLLQTNHLTPTFFDSMYTNLDQIKNTETYIDKDILSKFPRTHLVFYGLREGDIYGYTYKELYDTFDYYNIFQDPASRSNDLFSTVGIDKLTYMLQLSLSKSTDDSIIRSVKQQLLDKIRYINFILRETHPDIKAYHTLYHSSTILDQKIISDIFDKLLALTMYMRGWTGSGKYPIREPIPYNQTEVDIRVTQAFAILDDIINNNSQLGNTIMELPILQYRNGYYIPPTNLTDNSTISARLYRVRHQSQKEGSCIRVTSNWLAYSIYHYMTISKLSPSFDIEELGNFS